MNKFLVIALVLIWLATLASLAPAQQGVSVGWVTSLSGNVSYTASANTTQEKLKLGQEVYNGMTIVTEKNSAVRLLFQGDNVMTISQNTKLTITQYLSGPQKTVSSFDLLWGRVRAAVNSKILASRGDRFEVRTRNAVAGVRGSLLGVEYDPKSNTTFAGCGTGNCYITVGNQTTTIPISQILNVVNNVVGKPYPLSEGGPGSFNPDNPYDQSGNGNANPVDPTGLGDVGGDQGFSDPFPGGFEPPIPGFDPLQLDANIDGPGTAYQNFIEQTLQHQGITQGPGE